MKMILKPYKMVGKKSIQTFRLDRIYDVKRQQLVRF